MKIIVHYDPKPIPFRHFDYVAIDDDTYDYDQPIGYGRTEEEATQDLIDKLCDIEEFKIDKARQNLY